MRCTADCCARIPRSPRESSRTCRTRRQRRQRRRWTCGRRLCCCSSTRQAATCPRGRLAAAAAPKERARGGGGRAARQKSARGGHTGERGSSYLSVQWPGEPVEAVAAPGTPRRGSAIGRWFSRGREKGHRAQSRAQQPRKEGRFPRGRAAPEPSATWRLFVTRSVAGRTPLSAGFCGT
ncbi:unnamed protein product [Pylaiella littoralis]